MLVILRKKDGYGLGRMHKRGFWDADNVLLPKLVAGSTGVFTW